MATNQTRLVSNFIALIVGNLFRIVSFAATPYIAWKLGPAGYGEFSSGLVVALALSYVLNFGLDSLLVREVARQLRGAETLFGEALLLKLSAMPLGLAGVIMLSQGNLDSIWLYLSFLIYSLLNSYLLLICAVIRGLERMTLQAVLQAAQLCLIALGSVIVVWATGSVLGVAIAHVLATAVVLAVGYGMVVRAGMRPHYSWQPARWWALFRSALPFGLSLMGLMLFDRQAPVMIAALGSATAAGWFNIVYNLVLVISNIATVTVNLLFPILVRHAQESRVAVATTAEAGIKFLNMIGMPCVVWLYAHAALLIPLLFGPDYLNAVPLLRIVALTIPWMFLVVLLMCVLQTLDRQRRCAFTIAVGSLLMLPCYVLAIRQGGYYGGALAYVGGYVALSGALLWPVQRDLPALSLRRCTLPPLIASAGMALVFAVGSGWPLLVTNLVAGLVYGGLLLVTGGIGPQERAVLRRLAPGLPRPVAPSAPAEPPSGS